MEHRWGHRRELNKAVHLATRSGLVTRGRISNVSISGAFVVASLPVSLFSYIRIQFTAQLQGKRIVTVVEGQVVRKEATGFGVEWCELAPDVIRALVSVVEGSQSRIGHGALTSHQRAVPERRERLGRKARDILIHRRGTRFQ
jgi:PilZ domain